MVNAIVIYTAYKEYNYDIWFYWFIGIVGSHVGLLCIVSAVFQGKTTSLSSFFVSFYSFFLTLCFILYSSYYQINGDIFDDNQSIWYSFTLSIFLCLSCYKNFSDLRKKEKNSEQNPSKKTINSNTPRYFVPQQNIYSPPPPQQSPFYHSF